MAYIFKREPLTADETDRMINACQTGQEKLVVYGLLETGLRVGEFCALTPQNFRWQERFVVVDGKGGPFGKSTKKRSIPLSDRARSIFTTWFTINDKIPFGVRTVERIVLRIANRANITRRTTPHVLRHTFACNCNRKGLSVRAIQMILGHDNIGTTAIYLNLFPEDVRKEFQEKW